MFRELKITKKNTGYNQEKASDQSQFRHQDQVSNYLSPSFPEQNPEYYSFCKPKLSGVLSSKRLDQKQWSAEFSNGSNMRDGSNIIQLLLNEEQDWKSEYSNENRRKSQKMQKKRCRIFLKLIKLVKNNIQLITTILVKRLQKEKQYFQSAGKALLEKFISMSNQLQFLKSDATQKDKLIMKLNYEINSLRMTLKAKPIHFFNYEHSQTFNTPPLLFAFNQKKTNLSEHKLVESKRQRAIDGNTDQFHHVNNNKRIDQHNQKTKLTFGKNLPYDPYFTNPTIKTFKNDFLQSSKLNSETDQKINSPMPFNKNQSPQLSLTDEKPQQKIRHKKIHQIASKSLRENPIPGKNQKIIRPEERKVNQIKLKLRDELSTIKHCLSYGLETFK